MPKVTQHSKPASTNHKPVATSGVLSRIRGIEFDDDDGINILLYGRSGTGKTTLTGTFPKPMLILVCSGGDRPGELRSIDTPENRKSIKTVALQQSSELPTVVDYVVESGTFKTLVLDHASGLQDLVLKEILGIEKVPEQKSWGLATQQQWGQVSVQCKELFRCLLGFRGNVVFVAQERGFDTPNDSEILTPFVGAGLTPSLAGWVNAAVDYIGQTFLRQKEVVVSNNVNGKVIETRKKLKEVEYCLRTGPSETYATKFRLPKGVELPEALIDPTYDDIMELIRGGRQ